ncbi:MAG: beta-ketoacyl-ACP synthase III [Lachnospiraceae bacterium]
MIGKIKGTGAYVPPTCRTNQEIATMVETSDAWIQERTGIQSRHIISSDTTVTMAAKAAQAALEDAGIQAAEIDLIIVSTMSSNVIMPCAACEVQKILGATHATCFDLNGACTGFLFAYNTAQGYIAGGMAQTVLVIGTESLSTLLDWTDRGTCILFGDGAGAVILQSTKGTLPPIVSYSEGMKGEAITCVNNGYMKMDGQAVFKFAVKQVPLCIIELLDKLKITIEEIDYFILHQANRRIVESVAKRLHVSMDKFPVNIKEYGNTSSASIPLLLDEMNKKGELKSGHRLIIVGYGAGLSWGASFLEW